jgi:nitrite reductase/ring-hydroxylating ferredoxin subunit/Fe-S cluster biogenesis protein NfuA
VWGTSTPSARRRFCGLQPFGGAEQTFLSENMDDRIEPPRVTVETFLDRLSYMEQRVAAKTARWQTEAYRRAIENLYGEALHRLVGALQSDPGAAAILQDAANDDVIYTVLRRHDIIKPSIEARVRKALEKIRPQLATHGGNIEIVAIDPPGLMARLLGACDGCPGRPLTLRSILASALKRDCPEITEFAEASAPEAATTPIRLENEGWRPAGLLSEVPEEGARDMVIDREQVLLVRRGDAVKCFAAYCPHRGVGIDSRDIEPDGLLMCQRHGYQFDLATGECLSVPGLDLE